MTFKETLHHSTECVTVEDSALLFSAVLQLRHWFLEDNSKGDKIHLSETESRPIMPAVRRPENVQTYTHTHTHTNKRLYYRDTEVEVWRILAGKATKSFRKQPKVTSRSAQKQHVLLTLGESQNKALIEMRCGGSITRCFLRNWPSYVFLMPVLFWQLN